MEFFKRNLFYFLFLFFIFFGICFFTILPPSDFPEGTILNIKEGVSLRSVSAELKEQHIIRSRILFEAFVVIYGGEKHIIASDYLFENKLSVYRIARRIVRGERHLAPVKVTIPEGFNNSDIANAMTLKLPNFNKERFLMLAKDKEGYLFPDTYFFLTTDNEMDAIQLMSDNFKKKIASLSNEIILSSKNNKTNLQEIIIMASLIEKEAKGEADRGFISGILWRRLAIGMPLQVDAAPETYKKRGLPDSPIANPGLEAIKASMNPKNSNYLYYLHDKNGGIHYAKSFTEHRQNILRYLK